MEITAEPVVTEAMPELWAMAALAAQVALAALVALDTPERILVTPDKTVVVVARVELAETVVLGAQPQVMAALRATVARVEQAVVVAMVPTVLLD